MNSSNFNYINLLKETAISCFKYQTTKKQYQEKKLFKQIIDKNNVVLYSVDIKFLS